VEDATAAPRREGAFPAGPPCNRRRVLQLALLLPVAAGALGGCHGSDAAPDPLIALADAARADAALAAAAVAADAGLAARVDPLRAARIEHAGALDAEVARVRGTARSSATPSSAAPTAPPAPAVTLARVRDAVVASQRGAAELVPTLSAQRVGLVASVAACCATYAVVLT
jgi:hypothetical protein